MLGAVAKQVNADGRAGRGLVASTPLPVLVFAGIRGQTLMCIELLLDYRLRPRLLASRLMLRLELEATGLTHSNDRNVLDSLDDPKIALRHETVCHRMMMYS
jgi:hypothetical protein